MEGTCLTKGYREEPYLSGFVKMAGDLDFFRYLRNDEVLDGRQLRGVVSDFSCQRSFAGEDMMRYEVTG